MLHTGPEPLSPFAWVPPDLLFLGVPLAGHGRQVTSEPGALSAAPVCTRTGTFGTFQFRVRVVYPPC